MASRPLRPCKHPGCAELIIVALIPLALKGVKYREVPAGRLLSHNLLVYGLGGIVIPFIAIKVIDLLVAPPGGGTVNRKRGPDDASRNTIPEADRLPVV